MKYNNYRQTIHMEEAGTVLRFYLREADTQLFLFDQRGYAGIREYFSRDLRVPDLLNNHKWSRDKMVDHVVRKLPRYIAYVQKYAA